MLGMLTCGLLLLSAVAGQRSWSGGSLQGAIAVQTESFSDSTAAQHQQRIQIMAQASELEMAEEEALPAQPEVRAPSSEGRKRAAYRPNASNAAPRPTPTVRDADAGRPSDSEPPPAPPSPPEDRVKIVDD